MNDTEPQHDLCLPCQRGRCVGCLWRTRLCGCMCAWLVADMASRFPSLRRHLIEGDE